MNHLQQTIPQLPINILVTFYESAQSPSITIEEGDEKNWRVKVKPRLRWRMLMFVEMVLMQSIPNSYRENNRNQLLEVAYIIEKTMFAMVKHVKEYINLVSLPRRIESTCWFHVRRIMRSDQDRSASITRLCEQHLQRQEERECRRLRDSYSHGANAA
mmetsp:Transcript_33368/g.48292  ORF Transcript_33368/g.48292 Transcript_33368/m.48292 type:complete len:158 (-) Transcript_33368:42-515(-)